jgi:isopentenyl-diphosphate delta-isomerase
VSQPPETDLSRRKSEHLDVVLAGDASARQVTTGLERVRFEHVALPEIALADIDVSTRFLGRRMAGPLLVSSMTGGPARASDINRAIAEACEAVGIGFGVGSQRVAIERQGAGGLGKDLRRRAPSVPLLGNLGGAQLRAPGGLDMARRAVDMIEADALIIHLNPLQEAVQAGGDTDWRGLIAALESLARGLTVPIVAKEVGAGLSGAVARRLVDAGVAVIDVAGVGGTSWAEVEAKRAPDASTRAIATAFRDWGLPTADAIVQVRAACPTVPLIASGGIRDGLDVARALRLGADVAAQAAGVLTWALAGPEALADHLRVTLAQLRITCFCTASPDLAALKLARLV